MIHNTQPPVSRLLILLVKSQHSNHERNQLSLKGKSLVLQGNVWKSLWKLNSQTASYHSTDVKVNAWVIIIIYLPIKPIDCGVLFPGCKKIDSFECVCNIGHSSTNCSIQTLLVPEAAHSRVDIGNLVTNPYLKIMSKEQKFYLFHGSVWYF